MINMHTSWRESQTEKSEFKAPRAEQSYTENRGQNAQPHTNTVNTTLNRFSSGNCHYS